MYDKILRREKKVIVKNIAPFDVERAGRVFKAGKERFVYFSQKLDIEISACSHLVVITNRHILDELLEDKTIGKMLTVREYLKHPKVSIVVLVKDALEYVKKCLKSLNAYTNNFELIIVDNGSNKETKKFINNLDWFDYILITNKENKGFSYGNNQAIKIAKYDYICFLNSDTLLTPNWLGKLMKGFNFHKDVAIVGPSTSRSVLVQSTPALKQLLIQNAGQERINQVARGLKEQYIETSVVGFCFVIKKKLFEKIGVFDWRRYGLATHEDIDLLWRAKKVGFKSVWSKGSYVHHFGSKTTREMGLNPKKIRRKTLPIFEERKKDPNLYIKNDAKLGRIRRMKGTIPILMITWDRLEYTKQAIEAILKNTENPFKLVIIDNNSTKKTRKYLKGLKDERIQIIYLESNTGLVPPMNMFFRKFSLYKYVAKVDNDTIVSKDWLSKLKEVLEKYPLLAVEANHYLMLAYNIKTNDEFYKHLFKIDFKGNKLYLSDIVGGTGTLIRTALISEIPEKKGTLSGWVLYQQNKGTPSAFYTGVWIDRLDQVATNKYKEVSDYPEYDKQIEKMRPKRISLKRIKEDTFKSVRKRMKGWYEQL